MSININGEQFWLLRLTWPLFERLLLQWFVVLVTVGFAWWLPRISRYERVTFQPGFGKSVFWAVVASAILTVVACAVFVLYRIDWHLAPNGGELLRFALEPQNFLVLSVLQEIGICVFALLVFAYSSLSWAAIGFRRPEPSTLKVILIVFASLAAVALLTAIYHIYFAPTITAAKPGSDGMLERTSSVDAILASSGIAYKVWLVVFPSVVEECLFRGMLFQYFRKYLAGWVALLLQAVSFAAIHVEARQFIWLFAMGVIYGVAYSRTRSIYVPIFIHSFTNILAIL